ncbi:hypothetical protein PAPYR_10280 [Paratrimastix pyriformis]|uniref:Uncharacterized protein n=1 Tax=Paratrimastix pyriformis TaxID=342808 RepID=A0ABQ8UC20_9EUKA|nr:hypothetical protein PAPYR_10280 [Paratrimastix pyriformis]
MTRMSRSVDGPRDEPPADGSPFGPLRERIVELCRYDPSHILMAYARLSHAQLHAQLHALTEGCLGLFDGWMRRQAAWATDSISLRAWPAFPGTSPAMPYMAALRVGCPCPAKPSRCPLCTTSTWSDRRPSRRPVPRPSRPAVPHPLTCSLSRLHLSRPLGPGPDPERAGPPLVIDADQCPVVDPATGLLRRDETKPLTIQPVVRAVRAAPRASGLGRPCGGPASRGPGGRGGPLASISPLDARRLLETVTRAASTSVSLCPWPSCDMLRSFGRGHCACAAWRWAPPPHEDRPLLDVAPWHDCSQSSAKHGPSGSG